MTKLIITAFSFENPHLGARYQDIDRMLRSVYKGRLKNKCEEIHKMLTICVENEQIQQDFESQSKEKNLDAYLTLE